MDIPYIPQTKDQWIGFSIWFLCMLFLEFKLGKKQPVGVGSVLGVLLYGVGCLIKLFKKEKPDATGTDQPH